MNVTNIARYHFTWIFYWNISFSSNVFHICIPDIIFQLETPNLLQQDCVECVLLLFLFSQHYRFYFWQFFVSQTLWTGSFNSFLIHSSVPNSIIFIYVCMIWCSRWYKSVAGWYAHSNIYVREEINCAPNQMRTNSTKSTPRAKSQPRLIRGAWNCLARCKAVFLKTFWGMSLVPHLAQTENFMKIRPCVSS